MPQRHNGSEHTSHRQGPHGGPRGTSRRQHGGAHEEPSQQASGGNRRGYEGEWTDEDYELGREQYYGRESSERDWENPRSHGWGRDLERSGQERWSGGRGGYEPSQGEEPYGVGQRGGEHEGSYRQGDYGYGRGGSGRFGGSQGGREFQGGGYESDPGGGRHGGGSQRAGGWAIRDEESRGWQRAGEHTGRGPKGYQRSDERIREDVSDRLTAHGEIDASEISVKVKDGEVTLEGSVDSRRTKRLAEDCIEDLPGVKQVHNRLTVEQQKAGTSSERHGGGSTSQTTH